MALIFTLKRLLKCHPFHEGGDDSPSDVIKKYSKKTRYVHRYVRNPS
jgi:putative component of membrane protein insertase Oxa1/YidC/SpoIIIJ protein YidD